MQTLESQFAEQPSLTQVTVPDLWQQQAVAALREGKDVVVQAPTGAGRTLIANVPTENQCGHRIRPWSSRLSWPRGPIRLAAP